MKTLFRIIISTIVFAFFAVSCEKTPIEQQDLVSRKKSSETTALSIPTSVGGVTPYNIKIDQLGGTRTCEDVAEAFGCSFENTSERFRNGAQYSGSVGPIEWETDPTGTYVTWFSSIPVKIAVIVKGGDYANIYYYGCDASDCVTGDAGLASPPLNIVGPPYNPDAEPDQLKSITFCWTPCDTECEWVGETAWSAGNRYAVRGNWATYTPYTALYKSATLYAGQTLDAGTVEFSDPVDGKVTITITLKEGWRFEDVEENVKIQDYTNTPPKSNPAPGLFAHKGYAEGSFFSTEVPKNNYYGVHVNVEWEKCE